MSDHKERVRYAVVGAGNIAQSAVLPAFAGAKQNSQLVAVISGDPEKREELRKLYDLGLAGGYDEFEQILARGLVDAVYIALPNSMHREFTERAARAKVHVLCEKPMAGTVADCEAMIDVCREKDVKLMIAYRLHFEEANLRAVEVVQSGQIGEPRFFSSVFSQQVRRDDIRTKRDLEGGALLDMGVYPINAARYLFRSEPHEVFAAVSGSDPRLGEVDETTSVFLRFPGNRVAQLTCSIGASAVNEYRVVGTKGDLRVASGFGMAKPIVHTLTLNGEDTRETSFKPRDQFAAELIAFSRCVLENSTPEPSGREGLADVRIVEAAFESMRTGKLVSLPFVESLQYPSLDQAIYVAPHKEPKLVHAPSPKQP